MNIEALKDTIVYLANMQRAMDGMLQQQAAQMQQQAAEIERLRGEVKGLQDAQAQDRAAPGAA